ncbi:hypothetical protein BJX99DRAFT_262962 [Aspergillus californicus]
MKLALAITALSLLATSIVAQGAYGNQGYPPQGYPGQNYQGPSQNQYPQQQPQFPPNYGVQNKYSPAEAAAWHGCIDQILDQFNVGHEGTQVACSLWTCLEKTAGTYNRGGALAVVGRAINPICMGAGLIPGIF